MTPESKIVYEGKTELEKSLREGAAWFIKLADDLRDGLAREVPAQGHVWRHMIQDEKIPIGTYDHNPNMIGEVRVTDCIDFLQLFGQYIYIATCPRTGIRFVEGGKR